MAQHRPRAVDDQEFDIVMGSMSWIHWVIVAVLALLLFGGRGKLSSLMGDAAKGIRAFKEGLKAEDAPAETKAETPLPPSEKKKKDQLVD